MVSMMDYIWIEFQSQHPAKMNRIASCSACTVQTHAKVNCMLGKFVFKRPEWNPNDEVLFPAVCHFSQLDMFVFVLSLLLSTSTAKHGCIKTCCSEMFSTETRAGMMHDRASCYVKISRMAVFQGWDVYSRELVLLGLCHYFYINCTINKQIDRITQVLKKSVTEWNPQVWQEYWMPRSRTLSSPPVLMLLLVTAMPSEALHQLAVICDHTTLTSGKLSL